MATKVTVTSSEYFGERRNGSTFALNTGDSANFPLLNAGEKMRWKARIRIQTTLELTRYEINQNQITSLSSQNFLDEYFYAGGTAILTIGESSTTNFRFDISTISADGSTITATNIVQVDNAGVDIGPVSLPDGTYATQNTDFMRDLSPSEGLLMKFNFIGNDDPINFVSPYDQVTQAYKFDEVRTSAPSVVNGVWNSQIQGSNTGTATAQFIGDISDGGIVTTSLTGICPQPSIQEFEIIQDFISGPYYLNGEFANVESKTRPDRILNQDLRHVLNFEFRQALSNPNTVKLGEYNTVLGTLNYYGENYIDSPQDYAVSNVVITDLSTGLTASQINANVVNRVTLSVTNANNPFAASYPVVLRHSYLPNASEYTGQNDTFQDVWLYESLRAEIDGAPQNGSIITNLDVDLVGSGQIDVSFDIQFTAGQQARLEEGYNYEISLQVADDSITQIEFSDSVPLLIHAGQYLVNNDVPGLIVFNQSRFLFHPNELADVDKFSELKGWDQDGIIYEWDIDIERENLGAVIDELTVSLVAYKVADNTWFELDSVPYDLSAQVITPGPPAIQQIEIDDIRGFTLASGDIFNDVVMTTGAYVAPYQNYTGRTAFKISWQEWQDLPGADTVFYNPSEPNNGLNRKASNYAFVNGYEMAIILDVKMSQDLEAVDPDHQTQYVDRSVGMTVLDFGEQDGTPVSWTTQAQTFDLSGNDLNGLILLDQNVRITGTFTPSIAFGPDPVDYWAEVRLEDGNNPGNDCFTLSSFRTPPIGIPLTGPNATTNTSITVVSGSIIVEADTDFRFLDAAKTYNATIRFGLLDGNIPSIPTSFIRVSLNIKDNNDIGSNLRRIAVFQQNEQMFNVSIESQYFDYDNPSLIYRFQTFASGDPGIDGWDAIVPVSFAAWQTLLSTNSNGYACIETTDTGFTDGGLEVRYDRLVASTATQTATLTWPDDIFDIDQTLWLDKPIQNLSNTNSVNIPEVRYQVVTANPATEDWTDFSVPDLPSLEAITSVKAEGVKYGIRFAIEKTAKALGSFDFNFEYVDQQDVMFNFLESNTNVGYYRNWQNAVIWNKGVEYGRINNDAALNNLWNYANSNPFTICVEFEYNSSGNAQDLIGTNPLTGFLLRIVGGANKQIRVGLFQNGSNFILTDFQFRLLQNEKYQIVATYDGSGLDTGFNCYINSIKEESILNQTAGSIVSSLPSGGFYYHSALLADGFTPSDSMNKTHNIAIWDRVLTPLEIRRLHNDLEYPAAGLFRKYEFGQGVTATIVDTSPAATTNFENIDFATVLPVVPTRASFI